MSINKLPASFSFVIESSEVIDISNNLRDTIDKNEFPISVNHFIQALFRDITKECDNFYNQIIELIQDRSSHYKMISLSCLENNNIRLECTLSMVEMEYSNLKIVHISNIKFLNYHFDTISKNFSVIEHQRMIGKFYIDLNQDHNIIIGDTIFPKVLDIKQEVDNKYYFSRHTKSSEKSSIIRESTFFIKSDLLKKREISVLEDIWEMNNKMIKVEAKFIDDACSLIGGVVYDVTDFVKYKDIEYLQSVYELAITSGAIGIFYYDHEKYPKNLFEANEIYANLIGLDANEEGLYNIEQFKNALKQIDEEIDTEKNIHEKLDKLLKGSIDGTTDDVLKIENIKTKEIKYLLSSSKIDARWPDGSPKRFGGIIIDITERIKNEKNSTVLSYNDELTKLPNNRKLLKDLSSEVEGIGLFFDLDNFKLVNDIHGHLVGNRILRAFADSLKETTRMFINTRAYRLYGDEFFVFSSIENGDISDTFNDLLKNNLNKNLNKFSNIKVEASMGVSLLSSDISLDEFIKHADYEMYKEKIKKKEKIK